VNASDAAPALIALDARIVTTRRTLNAESSSKRRSKDPRFWRKGSSSRKSRSPLTPRRESRLSQVQAPEAIDFSDRGPCLCLDLEGRAIRGARIALGAVAPVPLRMKAVRSTWKESPPSRDRGWGRGCRRSRSPALAEQVQSADRAGAAPKNARVRKAGLSRCGFFFQLRNRKQRRLRCLATPASSRKAVHPGNAGVRTGWRKEVGVPAAEGWAPSWTSSGPT